MREDKVTVGQHEAAHGSVRSYTTGFALSVVFTLLAYWLVVERVWEGGVLVAALAVLAIAQLWVQLVFFLHLSRESKPRWNLVVFSFAVLVVLIVVGGSLWIMNNLDYHMMHEEPQKIDQQIIEDEGYSNEHSGHH
jgi:cytochrome o ubiquinol oxidase operon protein cyoD